MSNGFMKPQRMKPSLFLIWDQPLHILKGTGNLCLTMSFHDWHIDQEIYFFHALTDFQFQTAAVFCIAFVFLRIIKLHIIVLTKLPVTAHFECICSTVAYPGTLEDHTVFETVFFQIFQDSRHDFRMCCSSICRI